MWEILCILVDKRMWSELLANITYWSFSHGHFSYHLIIADWLRKCCDAPWCFLCGFDIKINWLIISSYVVVPVSIMPPGNLVIAHIYPDQMCHPVSSRVMSRCLFSQSHNLDPMLIWQLKHQLPISAESSNDILFTDSSSLLLPE